MHARHLLVPAALAAMTLIAADWARFRGPNGTGQSDDKDVPVKWAAKNILWKAELPGSGHSSPIVVKDRVFLLSATNKERLVVCIDAKGGKQLWAKKVPGEVGKTHRKSSMASATPCSDGERVYCAFWDGKGVALYAYDFDGKLVWERKLGAFKSQHGPGFSPIVHEGIVIVNNDQDGSSHLQAFHAKDGKPAWAVTRKAFRACYSTPFIYQDKTGPQLVVGSTAGVTRYDPASGKELWNFNWRFVNTKPLRTVGSPVATEEMVYLGGGDGDGSRAMIAVKMEGKGDVSKTNLAWDKEGGDTPYVPSMLLHKDHLYTVTDAGTAVCYDAKTGKELWRERMARAVSSSPVLINGRVFAVDEKGEAFVFEARPDKLNVVARNEVGEPVSSSPAVANGRLYIRGDKHLFCVGKP